MQAAEPGKGHDLPHDGRLDLKAFDLVPDRLRDEGLWDPDEEYWGKKGEPWKDDLDAKIAREA